MINNLKQLINEITSYITSDYINNNNIDIGVSNTLSMYNIIDDRIVKHRLMVDKDKWLLVYIVDNNYSITVVTEIIKEDPVYGTILKVLNIEGDTID